MGVDLKLLVVDGDCGDWGHAHTLIELGRNYEMHDRIKALDPWERPGFELSSFVATPDNPDLGFDTGYGKITGTPYGNPLTYCRADDLSRAIAASPEPSDRQIAAGAYLAALPGGTNVALFWH